MKKTGIVILTIALIAAICGSFYVVNDKSKRANQKEKVLTEVQRITTKDLDKNYPQTPREVVKLYNRIVKCYYGMQYSDEELDALTDQALKLFDDELAANNPKDTYKQSVTADAQSYKDQGVTLAQTGVCDSNDVKYVTDNGSKIAYVKASRRAARILRHIRNMYSGRIRKAVGGFLHFIRLLQILIRKQNRVI